MNKGLYLSLEASFPHSAALVEEAKKLSVTIETCTEAKAFLLSMHVETPKVVFIAFSPAQEKTISALIKSIRKVLGPSLSILVISEPQNRALAEPLLTVGASALLDAPLQAATLGALLLPMFPELAQTISATAAPKKKAPPKGSPAPSAPAPTQAPVAAAPKPPETAKPAAPTVPKVKLPEVVDWVFEELFPLLAKLNSTFDNLDETEARARLYAKKLEPIQEVFTAHIKNLKRDTNESEKLEFVQYVRYYGLNNCKFLITANKLLEITRGEPLKWDPKSKRPIESPKKVLQTAARFLDAFGEDGIFREVAFNCGVLFDFLYILASQQGERKIPLMQMYDRMITEIIMRTKNVITQAKGMQDSLAAKHILTIFALTEAGKFALAVHLPAYLSFQRVIETKECQPALTQIAEKGYFGASHNIIAALFALMTPGLQKAYSALLCARYPYILADGGEDARELQSLATLANKQGL